ncbi:hypothetical protein Tco_1028539 [Tanacetum coccineum]|uniref:Uncharacterized protein n=1 Tax=Tanacetum coccineum TaxID=301880 RepID=A0ABQ5G0W7_9ASTR
MILWQLPSKKSRRKGSQRKKSADPTEESINVSDESEPEPLIRRKTSRKSISLTKAEEEAAARQVHATHARIISESVPEPARRRRSDIAIYETTQKLKGNVRVYTPGTGGSNEGTGEIPGVPDESIFTDAEDDNEETKSDYDDIYPSKDPVEEPTDKVMVDEQYTEDIPISDEGHVSDPEDTDKAHMPKIPDTITWFRPILEEERPASPEPEWVIPPIDLPEADNN